MTYLTTKKFVEYFTKKIQKELNDKKYTECFFDFQFTETELPFDFNEEKFIEFFKENFNVSRIDLDFLGYKYRCYGKLIFDVKPSIGNLNQSDIDFMNQNVNEYFKLLNLK